MTLPRRKRGQSKIETFLADEQYDWLFPEDDETAGLPEDLQPKAVYERWAKSHPYELYRLQLKDWLMKQLSSRGKWGAGKMTVGQAHDLERQAEEMNYFGFPVETMPFYESVSKEVEGENFQDAYYRYASAEMKADKEAQQAEMQRRSLYTGYQSEDKAISQALSQGLITEQQASDLIVQRQWQQAENRKLLAPSRMSNEQLISAVQRGDLTNEQAFGTPLQQTVDQYGEPVSYRATPQTEYERRAAEQNQLANLRIGQQRGGTPDSMGLRSMIKTAKQAGLDTGMAEAAASLSNLPANTQALYINALAQQLGQRRKEQASDYNAYMIKAYPQQFEQFMKTGAPAPGGGFAPSESFAGWFQDQPDFENITTQREARIWDEYGDIMPTYLKQLAEKGYRETEPIEKWLETDPIGQVYGQRYKQRRAAQFQATKRRLAPLMRSY